jgi:uncharacterized protein (DUF1330 family)
MPAYLIADIVITNPEGYVAYRPMAAESVARHGGRFVARGGEIVALEGDWNPSRVVIIEFPSLDAAKKFYHSDDYQAALKVRLENSTGRVIIVDGNPPA